MKIQTIKTDVQKSHNFETINYGVSTDNLPLLFQMLRTNLYSDIHGSIIREICSNVIDSHTEAGKTDAVGEVEWIDQNRLLGVDPQLIIRDFGVGLSPERMRNIYGNYLSSTKRGSNDTIGGFGLGSKVPFAYTDSFFVRTVYEGMEYKYLCYIDESQLGAISLLEEEKTTRQNGTEIIIPAKNPYDKSRFEQAIKEQLAYFKSFRYINIQGPDTKITFENEDCIVSVGHPNTNLHIVLGNVPYPVDNNVIGLSVYSSDYNNCHVGLKFKIGELQPTLSREGLFWNESVKQKVLKKLEKAKAGIRKELEKELENEKNFAKWYVSVSTRQVKNFHNQWHFSNIQDKATFTTASGEIITVSSRLDHWFAGLQLKLVTPYKQPYSSRRSRGAKAKTPDYSTASVSIHDLNKYPIYRYEGTLSARKSLHLFETYPDGYIVVSDVGLDNFSGVLDAETRYKEGLKWISTLNDYDAIVVPEDKFTTTSDEDYKEAYKKILAQRKLEGKFTAKRVYVTSNWGTDYKVTLSFHMDEGKFEDEKNRIVIYGTQEESDDLLKVLAMLSPSNVISKDNLRVYKVSQANIKQFKLLPKAYHVKEVLEGKTDLNKYFRDIYTAITLNPGLKQYQLLAQFGVVDKTIFNVYNELSVFCKNNGNIKHYAEQAVSITESFAKDHKLINQDMVDKFNQIQEIFEKAKLLTAIVGVEGVEGEIVQYLESKGLEINQSKKHLVKS